MRFIRLFDNEVISVRFGSKAIVGEIESVTGELGQIRQTDGSFITPDTPTSTPQESLEDKITRLEKTVADDSLVQFEVLATIYEQLMTGGR